MLKQTIIFFCLFFLTADLSNIVNAQTAADSLADDGSAYNNTINRFYTAIGPQSRLYDGKEYAPNYLDVKGSPYFNAATDWGIGDIDYDGYVYKKVKLRYDQYEDEVIIPLYNSVINISLLNSKMTGFELYGHHFIYFKGNPEIPKSIASGFYDKLYGGKILLLCKRSESIQKDQVITGIISYFFPSINYYILKNNQYFTVNSKGALIDALEDKKKAVQQFIKANKISFSKDNKEQAMAQVAEYYDHLGE